MGDPSKVKYWLEGIGQGDILSRDSTRISNIESIISRSTIRIRSFNMGTEKEYKKAVPAFFQALGVEIDNGDVVSYVHKGINPGGTRTFLVTFGRLEVIEKVMAAETMKRLSKYNREKREHVNISYEQTEIQKVMLNLGYTLKTMVLEKNARNGKESKGIIPLPRMEILENKKRVNWMDYMLKHGIRPEEVLVAHKVREDKKRSEMESKKKNRKRPGEEQAGPGAKSSGPIEETGNK